MKRDLHTWKETCIHEKRPIYMKRDLCTWKETYIHEKRPIFMKRDLYTCKDTYAHEKRPTYMIRDLCKKQPSLNKLTPCIFESVSFLVHLQVIFSNHLPAARAADAKALLPFIHFCISWLFILIFFCFQIFTSGACRWYESAPFRGPQRQIQFSAVLQSPQGAPGRCVAACCSVLQYVAVLQRVAVSCSVLQCSSDCIARMY